MKRLFYPAAAALCLVPALGTSCAPVQSVSPPLTKTMVVESKPLTIDKLYPSMTGPYEWIDIDTSQMGYITAVRTEIIDQQDGSQMGGEYFCHSQLQIVNARLAVSATGAQEIRLPPGYGLPVQEILGSVPEEWRLMTFLGMLLNNHEPEIDRTARIRATIEYEPLTEKPSSLRRLYHTNYSMAVYDLDKYDGPAIHDDVTTHCTLVDGMNNHWIVPPGPQITRRVVQGLVPVPSTVHFAQVHLHNHGRYIKLTDKETGEVLVHVNAVYEPDRVQIKSLETFSSEEGFAVYPDRDYELEVFYDNTSDAPVDAMAIVYIYFNPVDNRELFMVGPARDNL